MMLFYRFCSGRNKRRLSQHGNESIINNRTTARCNSSSSSNSLLQDLSRRIFSSSSNNNNNNNSSNYSNCQCSSRNRQAVATIAGNSRNNYQVSTPPLPPPYYQLYKLEAPPTYEQSRGDQHVMSTLLGRRRSYSI